MKLEKAKQFYAFDQAEYDFLMEYDSAEKYGEVTQATEKRVNKLIKSGGKYAELVQCVWDMLREKNYFYRVMFRGYKTSVRQLKEMGLHFDNNYIQLSIPKSFEGDAYALQMILDEGLVSYWGTFDLSALNISDFNAFIKALYDHENERHMIW